MPQPAIDPAIKKFYTDNEQVMSTLSLSAIEKEMAERSLREYVEMAWHVLEPSNVFMPGWHIDAICEHLQAISKGDITRLILQLARNNYVLIFSQQGMLSFAPFSKIDR